MQNLKKNLLLASITIILIACSSIKPISRTQPHFESVVKKSDTIDLSYSIPSIHLLAKTQQTQKKGGIIITAEVQSFDTIHISKNETHLTNNIGDNPEFPEVINYDLYETSKTPSIKVDPENVCFNIVIRNNENVPLKLSEIGFAIIIDGIQWSFPTGYLDEWNKGLVLTGFEKPFKIKGPQINGLIGEGQAVYLFLNGVPTSYDQAGNVTKKENFEWYFECKTKNFKSKGVKEFEYDYKPVYREKCKLCLGSGIKQYGNPCHTCKGSGLIAHAKTPSTICKRCNGTGRGKLKCENCYGTGIKSFPKSQLPAETSSKTFWNGWVVKVKTIPSGANIKTNFILPKQTESPTIVDWLCTSGKTCPIEIEYQGKIVKVIPFKDDNSKSSKITVDFTGIEPIIKGGQRVD